MPTELPDLPRVEQLVIEMTNAVRKRENLGPVKVDAALVAAARGYARYLASTKTFSHTADGKEPADRAKSAGYSICQVAENLAITESEQGFSSREFATQTLEGWLNSPGHRANIVAPGVTDTAVAAQRVPGPFPKFVVVQMFGRPQSLALAFQISNATAQTQTYALSGKSHRIEPRMGVRHTVCEPKTIEFRSPDGKGAVASYPAQDGKVYTLSSKNGRLAVEIKARETVR